MSGTSLFPDRSVAVGDLLAAPEVDGVLELISGRANLDRPIMRSRVQKSGLVLAGHMVGFSSTRVQVMGETEYSYFMSLDAEARRARAEALFALDLSLMVIARGVAAPRELLEVARATRTPLAVAEPRSSVTIRAIHSALDRIMAPTETVHGVLIDVHGIGTLLLGPSGIGKSECALFLVERGHRLVADDRVILTRLPNGGVSGRAPAPLRHHMELRGIGIVNARDLFGHTAVRDTKLVQLVVELSPWDESADYDRLGLDDEAHEILGIDIPMLRIPVQPGRNMAVILEVAARNQLLKLAGADPARDFIRSLHSSLGVDADVLEDDPEAV